ncbi:MAG: universal stress protein [Myxococcales bacterium]|nr:universal stress protein [Myxococcales bacterium]MDH3842921.1 universal stress protein [Myxococcales bacterium]
MAQPLLRLVQVLMKQVMSTILTVTDLTTASYKLVGFAALVAGAPDGEVILVSTYGGGGGRRTQPPSDRPSGGGWKRHVEARLRREGQLLERQRQWCADQGVLCRAELYEDGLWPEFVVQSAERCRADLIMVGVPLLTETTEIPPGEIRILTQDAPCPVSLVRLPQRTPFSTGTFAVTAGA